MMTNYFDDYEGIAVSGSTVIPADEVVRLPDLDCKYAQLSVLTVLDGRITEAGAEGASVPYTDTVLNAASTLPTAIVTRSEVFYAFGQTSSPFSQLWPGQSSDVYAIRNLNEIVVRCHPTLAGVIHWTIFK